MHDDIAPDAVTDELLAARAAEGEEAAFTELVNRYRTKLSRYGRTFFPDTDEVEDLVQETFIKAYQNMKSFDVRQRFSPWVYRIAHNTFISRLRTIKRRPIVSLDFDSFLPVPSQDATQEDEHSHEEMRTLVERGMKGLKDGHREVLALYYFENLSYKEIADVLRIPIGTVGIRLARAKKELRDTLPAAAASFIHP